MIDLQPIDDGVTHINVYSKARTSLGRFLSNFALSPFTLKDHGSFESVEGYWYWLATGCKHEHLRLLHGYEAKAAGKKLERVEIDDFEGKIKLAIRQKLLTHRVYLSQLIASDLPLTHYYYYGYSLDNAKVVDAGYSWITDYIDSIRQACKEAKWQV
ncbi:hypothetical protein PMW_82 [Pseudomonas phage phiPMW]|uniref:Uncharacterized protein n=1 Tax=Pseudomonas phage phiPMW TaxID=1815582 RepID=A0A1S5R1E6_9CAUD|nr:hypothetical protein FDG97_gp082 [Pseudomonas phage phiPMW]ANA49207.1 hypothetical protein PMW_82 [Pseudomonas phage phiPMW]